MTDAKTRAHPRKGADGAIANVEAAIGQLKILWGKLASLERMDLASVVTNRIEDLGMLVIDIGDGGTAGQVHPVTIPDKAAQ